jgi:hypothetical protein
LFSLSRQLPKLGGKSVEGRLDFGGQSLPQNLPVLGLGRASVTSGATFQSSDQVLVQISDVQIS